MSIRAGDEVRNPVTGSQWKVLESGLENDGVGFAVQVQCQPRKPSDIPEHFHMEWTETFEIVSGVAHYRLDGTTHDAQTGDTIVYPAGHPHIHPWAAGDTQMVYRQVTRFAHPDVAAAQETLGVFQTLFGLTAEGRTNAKGLPKNPLLMAVVLKTLTRHGGYDAAVPIFVQKFIAATLGSVGEALGYRGVDERLFRNQEVRPPV